MHVPGKLILLRLNQEMMEILWFTKLPDAVLCCIEKILKTGRNGITESFYTYCPDPNPEPNVPKIYMENNKQIIQQILSNAKQID